MFPSRSVIWLLILSMILILPLGGCGKSKSVETPVSDKIAVIDLNKTLKEHPKYGEWLNLQKEVETLTRQLEVLRSPSQLSTSDQLNLAADTAALDETISHEYQAKYEAKKNQLNEILESQYKNYKVELEDKLTVYREAVDSEYQQRLFTLQLKLQTLQLNKEQTDELQKQLDTLLKERDDKVTARHQILEKELAGKMVKAQEAAGQELANYDNNLQQELSKQREAKVAALAKPENVLTPVQPANGDNFSEMERSLTDLKQQMSKLEEMIFADVKDKAAQVAAREKYEVLLTNYQVNVSAVDITDKVIAEIKKTQTRAY